MSEIVRNYIRVPLLSTCILMSSPLKIPYFPQRFHPRAYPSHGVPREGKLVDIFKCLPNARAFLILLKLKGAGPYSGFVKLISFSICLHESDIHKVWVGPVCSNYPMALLGKYQVKYRIVSSWWLATAWLWPHSTVRQPRARPQLIRTVRPPSSNQRPKLFTTLITIYE